MRRLSNTRTHTHTHTQMYTHTHTDVHTHTHTHVHMVHLSKPMKRMHHGEHSSRSIDERRHHHLLHTHHRECDMVWVWTGGTIHVQ